MKFEPTIPLYEDGLMYTLPTMPDEKDIDGYILPSGKQKFQRQQFLSEKEFKNLSESYQLELLTTELTRRSEGYWFFNNGVPTYMTGSHYFYMNYWYMAAVTTPDGMPEYRWAQTQWAYFVDLCEKDPLCFGGIMMSGKRFSKTEFGLSHIYNMATLTETDALFGLQSLSAMEAKNNLFKGRLLRSHRRIPNYLKPKSNDSKGTKEISSELTFKGDKEDGKYQLGLENVIDWRPTHASAYQGKRPREVYWDEPGTMEEMDIEDALSTVKQQLQIGKKAYGKIFMPATIEVMTAKGAPLFENIWKASNPSKRDGNGRTQSWLYRYFNPHFEGREDFIDEFGNSKVDEAKLFRKNELDIATPSRQKKIKRQYPETVDEAFDVVVSNFWENDVREILNERRKVLSSTEVPIKKIKLFTHSTGDLVANAAKDSDETCVYIFEDPKPHVKYYAGFDGAASDKDTGNEEGSAVSVTILKGADSGATMEYCPVAYFKFRPDKMEDGYRATLNICKHFGQYGNLKLGIERNAGQGSPLITHFIKNGYRKMLLKKQKIAGINKDDEKSELYGWYRNTEVIDVQKSYSNEFIRNFAHNIPFLELIKSLIEYGRSNQDFADSFISAVYTMGDWTKRAVVKSHIPKVQWHYEGLKRTPNGLEEVWKQY